MLIKSERLSDMVLKIQYTLMMVMYCLISVIISIPILPLLYIKIIANAIYIASVAKRSDYPFEHYLKALATIFLGPITIFLSMLIDLLALPGLLLKEESAFEYKY